MANTKIRKPITSRTKGIICLALLLAITVFASCLALGGMPLDSEGVNVLLPWVPVSSANWPQSLALNRALGGGEFTEWTAALPAGAEEGADLNAAIQDAVKVIRDRLDNMGEKDAAVSANGDTIRVETRKMSASRLDSMLSMSTMNGQFVFAASDGAVTLTEKDMIGARLGGTPNASHTSYTYYLEFMMTKEAAEALAAADVHNVSVTCDGESISTYATVSDDTIKVSLGSTVNAYNTGANLVFLANTGAIDVALRQKDAGDVTASAGGILSVVLIVAGVLLLAALVYLVLAGKLTGVSAILTIWCAVMLGLFFFATIVVPSILTSTVPCLVALLLGILLAIFAGVTRTDAISKQIGEGYGPKQASKLGFRNAARTVWIAHGGALAVSLLLMIFTFSQPAGYSLCAMVVASAMVMVLMRAFQACFTAITSKASLFGKTK